MKLAAATPIGEARTNEAGQPVRTFQKEIVQAGRWKHPASGQIIDIPQTRLSHWKNQFDSMKTNGMKVYVPVDHTRDPLKNRGWNQEMEVVGDKLVATMELIGEEAIALAGRIDVSIQARDLKDGKGNEYPDAIEHIALVADPVITGLGGFVCLSIGSNSMELLKKIAAAMGIDAGEMDEAALADAILAAHAKSKDGAKDAEIKLSAAANEISTLKLSSKPLEIDPDLLESEARNVKTQLEMLVLSKQITPALRDKFSTILCGDENARPALMLSRKAATAAGFKMAQAQPIIDALKEMPKPTGSGSTTSLSREGEKTEAEFDQAKLDAEVKKLAGK